jgi:hypothetical protein
MARRRRHRSGFFNLILDIRKARRKRASFKKRTETKRINTNNLYQKQLLDAYDKEQKLEARTRKARTKSVVPQPAKTLKTAQNRVRVQKGTEPVVTLPQSTQTSVTQSGSVISVSGLQPFKSQAESRAALQKVGLCGAPTLDGSSCLNGAGCSIPAHRRKNGK